MADLKQLLESAVKNNASDLHLVVGSPPVLRIDSDLKPENLPKLMAEEIKTAVFSLLSSEQKNLLLTNKELDFSFNFEDKVRIRANTYFEKGNLAAAFRLIPFKIKSIDELNLPKICHRFASLEVGFILVTGPTGHGKSSTLAAIIDEINQTRKEHIVTIEDPVEYLYQNKLSIISQRELHQDTHSWQIALRSVLREDPDVVLIGEMRDYETIASALTIAETGHLVFATLHTNSASQTIDRIVDVFPETQQAQVRMQLANCLEAVFSQRLLPAIGGGRVPASEVMLSSTAIKTTIREGKTHLIDNVIQTSSEIGMMTLESNLAELIRMGKISRDTGLAWSTRPKELLRLLGEVRKIS